GTRVSGDWFRALGVTPILGRPLGRDDDEPGRDKVVVLSHGLWTRLFAASRSAVGKSIELNGESYQIVGVMPANFFSFFTRNAELYVPLALPEAQFTRNNEFLSVTARLKPGVAFPRAVAEMKLFSDNIKRDRPNAYPPSWYLQVRTLDDIATGKIRPVLLVLLGAVGFVLLIACANVANL